MNIEPKTSLQGCLINKKDIASNATNKKVSFANFINVKNISIVFDDKNDSCRLVSSLEKADLAADKDTRKFTSAPFGSFLRLKKIIKDFFDKPISNGMTNFNFYKTMLSMNNPKYHIAIAESLLVSEGNGNNCIMKQIAKVCEEQNKLFLLQNDDITISKEVEAVLQALNNLNEHEILNLQVKDLYSQSAIESIKKDVLLSRQNTIKFIQQITQFLDSFLLLKITLGSINQ